MNDEKQLKTIQIVVTLNLDCSCRVGPHSDRLHVVWIALIALTDKPTILPPPVSKLCGEVMPSYAAFNGELRADD